MANTKPDSSQIAFLQSGTGAIARTTQDKLREVVSVKDKQFDHRLWWLRMQQLTALLSSPP